MHKHTHPFQDRFWSALDELVSTSDICIDRPRGSTHPRYPAITYPLDYGFLANTRSPDRQEIDIWKGSLPDLPVAGVIVSVDCEKRDSEIKILLSCTEEECRTILEFHNSGGQSALFIARP